MKPLAKEVARLISERQEDPRVKWHEDGRVRVHVGKIIPDNAAQQTVAGRRKRFWESLDGLLARDWKRSGTAYTPLDTNVESKA